MRARLFKFICIILAVSLAGGCWDAKNIEDREICTAVIVDRDGDSYVYWVELAAITSSIQNPSSEMGNPKQPMTNIVSAGGKTLMEARDALDRKLNKMMFLGAVQALIMTQDMAEQGIEEYIYRVRQMTDFRKTVDIVVTADEPQKFMSAQPENTSAVGFAIEYTLDNVYRKGGTFHMSLADLLEKLLCKNNSFLATMLSCENGQIGLSGYAVFDGSRMTGSIPVVDSKGVVFIVNDQKPEFNYSVPVAGMNVAVKAASGGRSVSAEYKDSKVCFDLDFQIDATEMYTNTNRPITFGIQEELKRNLEEMIAKDIYDAIETSRDEFKCDYMSFSDIFRIKYPDLYESMDWRKEFQNAVFSISVEVHLTPDKTLDYNPTEQQ